MILEEKLKSKERITYMKSTGMSKRQTNEKMYSSNVEMGYKQKQDKEMQEKMKNDEIIKKLEEEEAKMLEKLQKTIQSEQRVMGELDKKGQSPPFAKPPKS